MTPLLFAGLCAACTAVDEPSAVGCTGVIVPGIIVEIRDAADGKAIADLAAGIVQDGAFTDSLRPAESSSSQLADLYSRQSAFERPGTYAVHVERAGYSSWDTAGIVVTKEVCHVSTVRLNAALSRTP